MRITGIRKDSTRYPTENFYVKIAKINVDSVKKLKSFSKNKQLLNSRRQGLGLVLCGFSAGLEELRIPFENPSVRYFYK